MSEYNSNCPKKVLQPNNNFAPSLFRSLCEFVGDCFGPRYFSSGAALPQKNTLVQSNHLRFHTMTSKKMVRSYHCLGLNIMEYNTFQHQDQTNFEVLHAQEYTPMNDIAYHVCPDLKKKKKKIDLPTLPIFGPKGQTNLLFFRSIVNCQRTQKWHQNLSRPSSSWVINQNIILTVLTDNLAASDTNF